MKIDFVINRYPPSQGGGEFYAATLVRFLQKRGHLIQVHTSSLKSNYQRELIIGLPNQEMDHRVSICRYRPVYLTRNDNYPIFSAMAAKLFRSSADLIHAHSLYYFSADISGLIGKLRRKPFVLSPYFALRANGRFGTLRKLLNRLALSAGAVLVLTEYEKIEIEKYVSSVTRFETIPPGVNTEEFDQVPDNVFERFFDTKNHRVLLFVGRLDHGKGVDILIKALPEVIKKYPEVKCCIIGEDFGAMTELKTMAEETGVANNLIFTGKLDRQEVCSAFVNADIFVFPSRYEAFGMVLIEAMAAYLPVVAARSSAIPWVVKENEDGLLFDVNDHHDLAQKIMLTLSDASATQMRITRARKKVETEHAWPQVVEKLENVYSSLLR
ncbi:glycosyltransferase family 4 protein [bacterium]|nr:glycosyltransferase family 4 protein [bacterium]